MRLAAIATSALLGLGLVACGGDESEVSDVVPKSVPELTVGENTGLPAAPREDGETDTTDTTSTTDTTETTTGAAPAPAPAPTPTPTPQAPATGGSPSPGTDQPAQPQQDQGEGSGGFSDFCAQNPGACPGN